MVVPVGGAPLFPLPLSQVTLCFQAAELLAPKSSVRAPYPPLAGWQLRVGAKCSQPTATVPGARPQSQSGNHCRAIYFLILLCAWLAGLLFTDEGLAQEPLQPGEAFVTRFSGIATVDGKPAIDINGTVGSVVDLRNPSQAPQGHHWLNEPQRLPVTAARSARCSASPSTTRPAQHLS